MAKVRYGLLVFTITGLLVLLPGCFQIIRSETTTTQYEQNHSTTSTSQSRFLWLLLGASAGERFGTSIAFFNDVDGIGNPGVAVGATAAGPSGKNNAGSVYVISLKYVQVLYRLDGKQNDDQFGRALAAIGDLDGDKVADFAVGAPLGDVEGFTDAGYIGIYSGIDGKQLDYYTGTTNGFRLGHSLAGPGDLDSDGIPDYALGTPFASHDGKDDSGLVIIALSGNSPVDRQLLTIYGEAAGDYFGWTIAGIGDVNGDQVADIAVGAPGVKSSGEINIGRVYVLSGNDGAILYRIDGREPGEQFGYSITGTGDINGDLSADLVVGAPEVDLNGKSHPLLPGSYTTSAGSAYVFSGKDGSLIFKLEGSPPGFAFGFSVASGDVNGDSLSDIIVGDPSAMQNHGSVYIFSGRDGKSLDVFTNNPVKKEAIGFSLNSGNDLNGDGCADVIVGASNAPNIEGKPTGLVYIITLP